MKRLTIFLTFLLSVLYSVCAKTTITKNDDVLTVEDDVTYIDGKRLYVVVENPPEFIGGHTGLIEFLQDNLVYPQEAYDRRIQGKAVVEFVVHEDGTLSHFKVINDVHHLLAEEALRVARLMPKWEPGVQKGEKVLVRQVYPITFKIENDYLTDEEIIDYYLSLHVASGLEYLITELQERDLFMFPFVKKKYLQPQIFTEQPNINVETFQQLESLSQEVLIHYYIEAVISFREKGTEEWTPQWYLVLMNDNRDIISLIPYYP